MKILPEADKNLKLFLFFAFSYLNRIPKVLLRIINYFPFIIQRYGKLMCLIGLNPHIICFVPYANTRCFGCL